jgi:sialate O-acetylesterase
MKRILTLGFLFASIFVMQAKVELPPIFADNMVLQQQTDAALWGHAKPNSKATITTTWSKAKTTVSADADGKWFTQTSQSRSSGTDCR